MEDGSVARCILYAALLLGAGPGCQALQPYRTVVILVRDAETQKPISAADVRIWYPLARPSNSPQESSGATGADGVVCLRAKSGEFSSLMMEATAQGYMAEEMSVP